VGLGSQVGFRLVRASWWQIDDERSSPMRRRTKVLIAGTAAGALALGGTGWAMAGGADDDATDTPITGSALDHASAAALEHTGEGRVTETEVGDEESYYEVEVTLDDGSQVDVQLDEQFNVVGDEADNESEADD
jgi:hypothetical protein